MMMCNLLLGAVGSPRGAEGAYWHFCIHSAMHTLTQNLFSVF